jgi:hypothetical protein
MDYGNLYIWILFIFVLFCLHVVYMNSYGAFTLDVKSILNENLGGILGGTQC